MMNHHQALVIDFGCLVTPLSKKVSKQAALNPRSSRLNSRDSLISVTIYTVSHKTCHFIFHYNILYQWKQKGILDKII